MSTSFSKSVDDHALLELLEAQVILSSKPCSPDLELTLAQICGSDFWEEFDRGEATRLGALMKTLVANKRVPFIFVRANSANHALYRLANEEV